MATPNKQSMQVVAPPQQKRGRNQDTEARTDIKVRKEKARIKEAITNTTWNYTATCTLISSIHRPYPFIPIKITGICCGVSQLSLGERQGFTLDRSPAHRRAYSYFMHSNFLFMGKEFKCASRHLRASLLCTSIN